MGKVCSCSGFSSIRQSRSPSFNLAFAYSLMQRIFFSIGKTENSSQEIFICANNEDFASISNSNLGTCDVLT